MDGSPTYRPSCEGMTLEEQEFDFSSPDTGTLDIKCSGCGWKGTQNWEVTSTDEKYSPADD